MYGVRLFGIQRLIQVGCFFIPNHENSLLWVTVHLRGALLLWVTQRDRAVDFGHRMLETRKCFPNGISPKPSLKPPPLLKPPPTSSDPRSEIWLDFQKSGPETKIWGHLAQNAMQNPIFSPAALYSACLKAFPPCIEC